MKFKMIIAGMSALCSLSVIAGAGIYDDKYMYDEKELIRIERAYKQGKADGAKTTINNIVQQKKAIKDLSEGANTKAGFYGAGADSGVVALETDADKAKLAEAESLQKQIDLISGAHNWGDKVRKEVVLPGEADPELLELDRFLNQPLIIEQSEPANLIEIVVTTMPAGWRVFFSNFVRDDFIDEYEFFVPTLPRGAVFQKLEESLGVKISVMNQPNRPYIIVSKEKGES